MTVKIGDIKSMIKGMPDDLIIEEIVIYRGNDIRLSSMVLNEYVKRLKLITSSEVRVQSIMTDEEIERAIQSEKSEKNKK